MKRKLSCELSSIRIAIVLLVTHLVSSPLSAQCNSANPIEDPEEFQWTYHPVTANNPQAYYSGTMEVGDTTFTFNNGETLTTRAYRQKGNAYSIPGPTLKMTPGNKYILSFHNLLPYEAKNMSMNVFKDPNVANLHTHGLHISGESPGDDVTRSFEGGRGGDFVYDIPADHMGGTYWYHAHHHGATTLQVSGGMFGMIVIDDGNDGMPANVAAMEEKLLIMGKIDPSVAGLGGDQLMSGSLSSALWTVNGIVGGEICMPPNTWQHWRVSIADPMAMLRDLEFGPECEVMVLARDGVWRTVAPKALNTNTLKLTGASRADFAIRSTGNSWVKMNGMTIATISTSGVADPSPHPFAADGVSQWSAIRPSYLRDLRNEPVVNNESISMGARTVNGSKYSRNNPTLALPTTDVQEWSLSGNVRHPFHLHVYHVQALVNDRDFEAGEYYDVVASQMDVRFDLNASTTTTFSGRTIMHCHILDHEDRGAMGWLDVQGGQGPPTFPVDGDVTETYAEYYILGGGTVPQLPAPASNLQASALNSSSIELNWIDNSTNEDGFKIERSLDGTNFSNIATTGVDVVNYTDNNLSASTTYYYKVTAFNATGDASSSNVASATTLGTGGPIIIHVDNIQVTREALNGNRSRGVATVTIVDDSFQPVAGANVSGVFSGPNSTATNGITDQNGAVTMNSQGTKNANSDWCYEVQNVQLSGATYNPTGNELTTGCEGGTGAKSLIQDSDIMNFDILELKVHPNPTKSLANISFSILESSNVELRILDLLGAEVSLILDQKLDAGNYTFKWDDYRANKGTYLIELKTEKERAIKRVVLIK